MATDVEYRLVDVLAGVKVAGYTFLIHTSTASYNEGKFDATYAPIGIGINGYDSIESLIAQLDQRVDSIGKAIEGRLQMMALDCIPLLAPENGIETNDWKYREQCRFDSGEYKPVPQVAGWQYPKAHYVHLSVTKTESDFVAYTPSESYGQCDRQVRLKFGKYLRKAFEDMSDAEVQAAVVGLRAQLAMESTPATLKFATDTSTINDIFETEMYACDSSYASCMHGKFAHLEHRPYHVYAGSPDVAVAYVVDRGEIVARSVVSTCNKQYVRAYSVKQNDSTLCRMLESMLEREGYTDGTLRGSRLTKLPSHNGAPVLPYIDHGGMGVESDSTGKWWRVTEENEGEYNCDQTDGTASECGNRCSECERLEEDCECFTCQCCETRSQHGCEECSMCEECDRCTQHDSCRCHRCSECNNIINPSGRHTSACQCERCGECGELDIECDCSKCQNCGGTGDCDCDNETDTETETKTEHRNKAVRVYCSDELIATIQQELAEVQA